MCNKEDKGMKDGSVDSEDEKQLDHSWARVVNEEERGGISRGGLGRGKEESIRGDEKGEEVGMGEGEGERCCGF